jgi:ABC-type phosphate/phosphonate transport system permease subunit
MEDILLVVFEDEMLGDLLCVFVKWIQDIITEMRKNLEAVGKSHIETCTHDVIPNLFECFSCSWKKFYFIFDDILFDGSV